MFEVFNQIGNLVLGPLMDMALGFEHIPFIFAFFLGLVGAVAPCQLTSNISAVAIYGNKSLVEKVPWAHVWLFILGKIIVFSLIGLIFWFLGREVYGSLAGIMPVIRKFIGPLLIVIGLFMLGLFQSVRTWRIFNLDAKVFKDNLLDSFLMGVSFTLAFCPTMFVLFLLTLMPIVVVTSYGAVLPAVFGIGTSFPLIIVIFLIWYFGASGAVIKRSRKIGSLVQKVAGAVLIIIGISDALVYWF